MRKELLFILLMLPVLAKGQEERKYIREGYKAYLDENYSEAEIGFRKAEEANKDSYIARYNTAAALYQQEKLEESGERFAELIDATSDPSEQAKLLHNMGNVMLESEQYKEAAEAYKKSLKLNPSDNDTRYNLAYALEKLREQQEQEQNQDQEDQENQENQDQQDDQDQQQQDQENEEQQDQQQQDQDQEEEQQPQEEEQQQQQLSKEEAERLLDAILQKEEEIKEEVDKKKAQQSKIKTEKDW